MLCLKDTHEDARGGLYVLEWERAGWPVPTQEVLVFTINKGYARGGDYHKSRQFDIVIAGKVECRFLPLNPSFPGFLQNEDVVKVLNPGEVVSFEAGSPHMFTALEASLMVEWLVGPFEKTMYPPYRKIVEEKMK